MTGVLSHKLTIGLGLTFLLTSVTVLVLNKRQRQAVLDRIHFQRRRTSGAKTPPRSLSPGKKDAASISEKQTSQPSAPDYVNVFPPSRRDVLPKLAETASVANRKILIGPEPTKEFLRDQSLPTTRSYDLDNDTPKYTPTGFSTEEIKAMGDFPDYSILSGVPLPEAYEGFDPTKALPRPYRPFRWAYHQTMCKYPSRYTNPSQTLN
jgi:hypothetical protein